MTIINFLLTFSQNVDLFIAFVKVNHELKDLFEHLIESKKLEYILHEKLNVMIVTRNSEHMFELLLSDQY